VDSAVLRLLIEPLDLGADVRAISLDLAEEGAESPATGQDANALWAAAIPALAANEVWAFDFVSHLDRVRDFCRSHAIAHHEPASRCVVIPDPGPEKITALVARFEGETFGFRVGGQLDTGDPSLESELSKRGMDAYQDAYSRYSLCAICDFENGSLTVLSEKVSSAEILRRLKPALSPLGARVERPNLRLSSFFCANAFR
jgi:hypothetical protein